MFSRSRSVSRRTSLSHALLALMSAALPGSLLAQTATPELPPTGSPEAGSEVILIGPFEAGDAGTSGIDNPEDVARIPDKFPGLVWTNEIATIAPILEARN